MNKEFILLLMIFMHIIDDYYLQGILSQMKQKRWWETLPNFNIKYNKDYILALFMHSFSWTFMIMLPVAYIFSFNISILFLIAFLVNLICHALVDNAKANDLKINLIQDQCIHIVQIVITWAIFAV